MFVFLQGLQEAHLFEEGARRGCAQRRVGGQVERAQVGQVLEAVVESQRLEVIVRQVSIYVLHVSNSFNYSVHKCDKWSNDEEESATEKQTYKLTMRSSGKS